MNGSRVRDGEGRFITFVFFFIDKKGDSIENNKIKDVIYISFFTSINSYTFVRFLQNMQREKIGKSNR